MLEPELQQAHAHLFRIQQDPRVVRAIKIRPRGFVHWDDDAAAIQLRIIWQFHPRKHFGPVGQLRLIRAQSNEAPRTARPQEMKKPPRGSPADRVSSIKMVGPIR